MTENQDSGFADSYASQRQSLELYRLVTSKVVVSPQ